jgi:hypothetical protein
MPTLNEKVATWAGAHRGQFVGPLGECYDLANKALTNSGAKSAPAFCEVTEEADYIWGSPVNLLAVQRGDILQFRDYGVQETAYDTVIRFPIFGGLSETVSVDTPTLLRDYGRRHHTAVVKTNRGGGTLDVFEQNAPKNNIGDAIRIVLVNVIDLQQLVWAYDTETARDGDYWVTTYRTVVRVVVGKVWAYRPVAIGEQPTADNEGDSIFGSWA